MKKIKIVFIIGKLDIGGAAMALYDLITLMDKSKYDVSVFVQFDDGELEQKYREAGICVVHLFERRVRDGSVVRFVKHQIRKIRILCCLHNRYKGILDFFFPEGVDIAVDYSSWEAGFIAFGKHNKTVKFIHGDPEDNLHFLQYLTGIKDILPLYNKTICVSRKCYDSYRRIMGISEGVECHYNPIISDNIRSLAESEMDGLDGVPYLCAVGRLAPEKAYDRLIRIHRKILDRGIAHRLMIVGEGKERKNLEAIIRETGTEDTVQLVGFQKNPYPYMKNSYCVVCSSYTEGLPVIAMESLILGVPFISAVPSVGEIFGDTNCGIITENNDESLEEGIVKMLSNRDFYKNAKQGALNRSGFFDGGSMVKEIEKLFDELMKGF